MIRKLRSVKFLVALVVLLLGCFSMVQRIQPSLGSNSIFEPMPDSQTMLVGLAVSGGGSRAATFAAGALEALAGSPAAKKT